MSSSSSADFGCESLSAALSGDGFRLPGPEAPPGGGEVASRSLSPQDVCALLSSDTLSLVCSESGASAPTVFSRWSQEALALLADESSRVPIPSAACCRSSFCGSAGAAGNDEKSR